MEATDPKGVYTKMPLYEYTCETCLNTFEKLRSFDAIDDPAPCPDCGSNSKRQLSVFMSFSTDAIGQTTAVAGGGGGCCGGGGAGCACSMSA
jgi:putative FmdB family regulatory protein